MASKLRKSKEEINEILVDQAVKHLVLVSLDMMEGVQKSQLLGVIEELKVEIRKSIKKAGFSGAAKKIFNNS